MLEKLFKGLLKFLKVLVCIAMYLALFFIVLCIIGFLLLEMASNSGTTNANKERLKYSLDYDHKAFPHLGNYKFFYENMDVGDSGSWAVVYDLDPATKEKFLNEKKNKENIEYTSIYCIQPTISTGWKILGSHLHYVNPPEWAKDHHDFELHDSFNTYGSEEHIKTVEEACKSQKFIHLSDFKGRHKYWAISEKENLFFSIYRIGH